MKKFFIIFVLVVLTVFNGCQKDESVKKNGLPEFVSSKYEPEFGKFREEIIVYDSSGENSLFIALYADEHEYIMKYLKNFKLELVISPDWNNTMLKSGTLSEEKKLRNTTEIPQLVIERKVTVEFLSYNLKDKKNYSLSVVQIQPENEKGLKSGDFSYGQYTDFVTTESFLGAIHKGYGWDGNDYDLMTFFSKKDCWLCGWDGLGSRLLIGDHPYEYYEYVEDYSGDAYKLGVGVYFDSRETDGACLYITDVKTNFRGHNCSIGAYDTANCYVGKAPTGTNAFINYNPTNGDVYFYYTPLPGNVCPVGLGFDGYNCAYLKVPSNCEPFILSNNWYVKPDRILN